MPDFYVEGHTAEGVPYGPVHVLTTPLGETPLEGSAEEMWEEAEQAREDAWRDAVMRVRGSDNMNNKEDK